jgi:hypothetical protein
MAFGFTRTLPTITGSHTDLPVLLVAGSFPATAIDGGSNSIDNGGGNLRAYTDDTKATQLSIEIVSFVTGGVPNIQVWVKIPSAITGSTIYLEADGVATSQPAFTASFGRNSVWSDYEAVIHANETGTDGVFVDSTGKGHDTTLTTGATLPTVTTSHPFGGAWPDMDTSQAMTLTDSGPMLNFSDLTLSFWANFDSSVNSRGAFGSRYSGGDTNWVQMQTSRKASIKQGSGEDGAGDSAAHSLGVNHYVVAAFDDVSLVAYTDAIVTGSDISIFNLGGVNTPTNRPYRIGTYHANAAGARLDGRIGVLKAKRSKSTADLITTEYANQSDPDNWGTSSAWVDTGGGSLEILPSSIPSSETFGVATISTGTASIEPIGIASGEAFGSASITTGTVSINPVGISSSETFGNAEITTGTQTITPAGIESSEAFGVASITTGAVGISPSGIPSGEAFGVATITTGSVTIRPEGIASLEAFGTPSITVGTSTIQPVGIGSSEAFGAATITTGFVSIQPTGIPSTEAFGQASIESGILISVVGIASGEEFGRPSIGEIVSIGDYSTSVMCEIKTSQSFSSIIDASGQSIRGNL